jgi:hypothetical protein
MLGKHLYRSAFRSPQHALSAQEKGYRKNRIERQNRIETVLNG